MDEQFDARLALVRAALHHWIDLEAARARRDILIRSVAVLRFRYRSIGQTFRWLRYRHFYEDMDGRDR